MTNSRLYPVASRQTCENCLIKIRLLLLLLLLYLLKHIDSEKLFSIHRFCILEI